VTRQAEGSRRQEAEGLRRQLHNAGFADFELPPEIQDFHLDIMRRDLLIQQGKLGQVLPELRKEISNLGLAGDSGLQQTLVLLDRAAEMARSIAHPQTGATELDLNKEFQEIAIDAAMALQKIVATRRNERLQSFKRRDAEERAREREARGGSR
jgi:hypothetical protein